jgi:hypothetical protein
MEMAISGSPLENDHSRQPTRIFNALEEANMAILLIFVCIFPELFYVADDPFAQATLFYPNKVS